MGTLCSFASVDSVSVRMGSPDERQRLHAEYATAMGDDLCAGLDVERGHLRQPFFHAGDDFAPRKMGTDATMRSIRKGVMRIGAAREKDFIGVLELPRISRCKYGRTRYVVPLLD